MDAPSSRPACRHRILAASGVCRIECCEHGTVHLALGGLTLRLATEEFLALCGTLQIASGQLVSRAGLH